MFCPHCGKQLPEGSTFCSGCGKMLSGRTPGQEEKDGLYAARPETRQEPYKARSEEGGAGEGQPEEKTGRRSSGDLNIIIAAAAIVIIAAAAFALFRLLPGLRGSESSMYAYIGDGEYMLITDIGSAEEVFVDFAGYEDGCEYYLLKFSGDGKYLYYFTDVDEDADISEKSGTLWRAAADELEGSSSQTSVSAEEIAENVLIMYLSVSDGWSGAAFADTDGVLYIYDSEMLAEYDIGAETVSAGSGYIRCSYAGNDASGTMYINLEDTDETINIEGSVSWASFHGETVYYIPSDGDCLYTASFGSETSLIAENVQSAQYSDGTEYFIAENDESVNVCDLIPDAYEYEDSAADEPDPADYGLTYTMIDGENLSEDDYDVLYTSCTQSLYWFGEDKVETPYNMYEAAEETWDGDTQAIQDACKAFIEEFADQANEDGFILVTDEVKEALLEINSGDTSAAKDGSYEWTWLLLCYSLEANEDADYEGFESALKKWQMAGLVEELKEQETALYTLYSYSDGSINAVCSDILDFKKLDGAYIFNTSDTISEQIEDISYASEVLEMINLDYSAENNVFICDSSGLYSFSAEAGEIFGGAYESLDESGVYSGSTDFACFSGNTVYIGDSDGCVQAGTADDDGIIDFSVISENAYILENDGDTLFYVLDCYEDDSGYRYGTLCSYSDGETALLAGDLLIDNITLISGERTEVYADSVLYYADGVIAGYSSYQDTESGGTFCVISEDGTVLMTAEDVTWYVRSQDYFLYISGGALYSCDGKKTELISYDAQWVWCSDPAELYLSFAL